MIKPYCNSHLLKKYCHRNLSSSAHDIFDRSLKRRQIQYCLGSETLIHYDYLREESSRRLIDRLEDIKRTFPIALDTSSYRGHVLRALITKNNLSSARIGGIEVLHQCYDGNIGNETSTENLEQQKDLNVKSNFIKADEENLCNTLPENSYDLILSNLSLHWINNIPKTLQQVLSSFRRRSCLAIQLTILLHSDNEIAAS